MRTVTDQEVTAALEKVAILEPIGDSDGWRWLTSGDWHLDSPSRAIARFCLMLDRPVSDVIRGDLFGTLVEHVAEVERRLDALEETRNGWQEYPV